MNQSSVDFKQIQKGHASRHCNEIINQQENDIILYRENFKIHL